MMRCNRCYRPMAGTTAYDGACSCGGLIEAAPVKTLFQEIQDAGIPWDHHESDLYVKATPEAARIIKEYGRENGSFCSISAFRDAVTGELWLDVAFMYAPFWEAVAARVRPPTDSSGATQ